MKFIKFKYRGRQIKTVLILAPLSYIAYAFSQDSATANDFSSDKLSKDEIQINNLVDSNYPMKEKTVNEIMNETGAHVLNVTDQKNKDGKSTIKFKVIKDGKVKIIEQNP